MPLPIHFRRVSFKAEEWWAARAHVIDPRIVLAKTYARQDGVRLYPLPDGELVPAVGITDIPFSSYAELLRDRAVKQAAEQGGMTKPAIMWSGWGRP